MSPCDLSTIYVQLILDHRAQIIQTNFDDKTKASNLKHILYKISRTWTRGDVLTSSVNFDSKYE